MIRASLLKQLLSRLERAYTITDLITVKKNEKVEIAIEPNKDYTFKEALELEERVISLMDIPSTNAWITLELLKLLGSLRKVIGEEQEISSAKIDSLPPQTALGRSSQNEFLILRYYLTVQ